MIRALTAADIPGVMRLNQTAGWNQTPQDWEILLSLAPDLCFGWEQKGEIVATTTAICYSTRLAWIGMVLTHPEYRGRGLARKLMEHVLALLDGRVDWIKLDATDMGRPLYLKLGFEDECPIERWGGQPVAGQHAFRAVSVSERLQFGNDAFGADRSALLRVLSSGESISLDEGFAMARPGAIARYLGPCVANTPEAAARLISSVLAHHAGERVFWDLLPANEAAVDLAVKNGFAPLRRLTRMARRGRPGAVPIPRETARIFAIAGFEYG